MRDKIIYIIPPAHPLFLLLLLLLILFMPFLAIVFLGSITLAFTRLGINPGVAFSLVILSLIGSVVNIKVAEFRSYGPVITQREVSFFGIRYVIPVMDFGERRTVLAVNLGGCVVPVAVSIYLIIRLISLGEHVVLYKALVSIAVATLIFKLVARPVEGVGIAMPFFVPPLTAALLGLIIAPENPVPVAFLSGTLGVLIGADLLNIDKIKDLGAPIASIGGAGTFDGIFLAGVISVLLV